MSKKTLVVFGKVRSYSMLQCHIRSIQKGLFNQGRFSSVWKSQSEYERIKLVKAHLNRQVYCW